MIGSMLTIWVDWDSFDPGLDCHATIDNEHNPVINVLDMDGYHTWLEDNGWLVLDDMAYCPVCRLELY